MRESIEEQSGSDLKLVGLSREVGRPSSFTEIWDLIWVNRKLFLLTVGGLLGACALYCLVAPSVYEASARVALRSPHPVFDQAAAPTPSAPGLVQIETLANELRSDELAWNVIRDLGLYRSPRFVGRFQRKFRGPQPAGATPETRGYLLDQFQQDLTVETIPRTLVLQVKFRSYDPALSAQVANAVIAAYERRAKNARLAAAQQFRTGVAAELTLLKSRIEQDQKNLADFQKAHGLFSDSGPNSADGSLASRGQIDELERELAAATAERILRQAQFRAASSGNPAMVIASDPKLQEGIGGANALIQHLRTRQSDLEAEQAQLRIEHGPNFPRVLEIQGELQDLDRQIRAEDQRITEAVRLAWKTAADRERLVQDALAAATSAGVKTNGVALQYAARRREIEAEQELYIRAIQQQDQASLAAEDGESEIEVIDPARQPVQPASPNFAVYMAVTLFGSLWVGIGGVLLRDGKRIRQLRTAAIVILAVSAGLVRGQAPTPSTSGLPAGVARIPQSAEAKSHPDAREAPAVWVNPSADKGEIATFGESSLRVPIAARIGPGDLLEVTEAHTPNQRQAVRVSQSGSIRLALAGEVHVGGQDEGGAAHAIEQALVERGILVHPQVNVLVTAYAGQDVSVLGEVMRPGVYAYTAHHRLLDLISAASGLSPSAGRIATIAHRETPDSAVPVVLNSPGTENPPKHNPELLPGDTVEVSRAGLVYVVGDVVRPGGFTVDPVQATTVVQALALAWGPGQNAALGNAVLIREQAGGRTITTLNLKRMLRGKDPDVPIRDRDILFVPDSMAKNLWNRTMESVIQSAAGVSIYSGLVYSQRF